MDLAGSTCDLRLTPDLLNANIAGGLHDAQAAAETRNVEDAAAVVDVNIASHVPNRDGSRRIPEAHVHRGGYYNFEIDRVLSSTPRAKRPRNVGSNGQGVGGSLAGDVDELLQNVALAELEDEEAIN